MMDLLQHLGFPSKFRDWIAALLSSYSSRVLLNGITGGLMQGDALSLVLSVLAIDPLHHLLRKATEQGRIQKLRGRAPMVCTSLYADDAAIFMAPIKDDINFLASTLHHFGDITGLITNRRVKLIPLDVRI
jgi:hypothetical protein